VMGRCRFIDEHDVFLGVEHPSAFESHRRVLEIWKGHCLPQPSIFWSRDVWDRSGPMRVDERMMLDYDLFCRMSRDYRFTRINRVLSNYRLHSSSKTQSVTDAERLEQAIVVSRRYWPALPPPDRLSLLASYAAFRVDRRRRASRLLREGRDRVRAGKLPAGIGRLLLGGLLAPEVAADVVLPSIRPLLAKARSAGQSARGGSPRPQTEAWLSRTTLFDDGWATLTYVTAIEVAAGDRAVSLIGTKPPGRMSPPLTIEAFVDQQSIGRVDTGRGNDFSVSWPLPEAISPGAHELRLLANGFLVPHDRLGNQDFRPLSYRVSQLQIGGSEGGRRP
jgi:hypothetical protein